MKVLLLDGSPKYKGSNSRYLLDGIAEKLQADSDLTWTDARCGEAVQVATQMANSNAMVLAFPLYVDSLPSHLLTCLEAIEHVLEQPRYRTRVYVIINSGFYDAVQNQIAIGMVKLWCETCGFAWGQAVAVGAGGMVMAAPIGKGPSTNVGMALDMLAQSISQQRSGENVLVEPNFPRFLYQKAAHISWYSMAKKNGVKRKQMWQQQFYTG